MNKEMLRQNRQMLSGADILLLSCAFALMMIGLVMIGSASIEIADSRTGQPTFYLLRHASFLGLGLVSAIIVYQIPLAQWHQKGWLLLFISFFLLAILMVPGIGRTINGSTRWIGLGGGLNLQASEFAKLLLIAYVAGYLDRRREEVLADWWGFMKPMIIMGLAALLLLMEPDFGATVVIGCSLMGMIFLSGAKLTRFLVLLAFCSVGAVVLVLIQPYRLKRLTGFVEPWSDPFGDGYQLTQALIAFGQGEIAGVGLGNSVQKLFYLPEAHTDFVFSILAEEFGLVGVTITIVLFSVLVYRAMVIGRKAEVTGNRFNAYFAYGLGILFASQAFINMGVNTGLLPTKGLTLPLVSYGGSSLLVSCMAIAVLTRIACETAYSPEGAAAKMSEKKGNKEVKTTVASSARRIRHA